MGLVGPAATPANAATCVGFVYNEGTLENTGQWECDPPCPDILYFFDGRWHLIVCIPSTQ